MSKEFKKISNGQETHYVLEFASGGSVGTAAVGGGSLPQALAPVRRRNAKEDSVTVPVKQKPRQGPLRPQTGGGKHRDKKKEQRAGQEKHRKPYFENFDNPEYNDEAGMAHSNLHTAARAVAGLIKTIQDRDNLPEWAQEKIAKAEQMLVTVWDYLLSQKEQGIDPKQNEDAFNETLPTTMADYYAGNQNAQDPLKIAQMRAYFAAQQAAQQSGTTKPTTTAVTKSAVTKPSGKQQNVWAKYGNIQAVRDPSSGEQLKAMWQQAIGQKEDIDVYMEGLFNELAQIVELQQPSGAMFLKFRIKKLPDDEQMILGYGGFGTTPKDVTVGNAKIKPFAADESADVIAKIREILSDKEFVGIEKIVLDIPSGLNGPLADVLDYAERDERVELYTGDDSAEPETGGSGKVIGYDPEGNKINREPPQAQVGGSSRGVASTGMVSIQADPNGQRLIQGLVGQGKLSRDTKVQGNRITLRKDDYDRIRNVLGNDRFQQMFTKVGSVAEGYSIARKMIAEGHIAGFIPPFSVMGNWVNDSRGRGICEMGESRAALKDIADALNAWVQQGVAETFQNDEANLMYRYDAASQRLKQRMVSNREESNAQSQGFYFEPEQALRAAGIIRSKFNPKKFVQKQGDKWIEVFPYGKPGEQGVAEGSDKNVVKSIKVGNFRHDLVDTGMGWQVRIYNGDKLYDTGLSKNSEQKGLAALEDAVAYTEKQTRTKRQGVAEGDPGAKYKIKQIGHDAGGDYYISPSTGKKVYKKANRGDHENPNTGEIKSTAGSKSFKIAGAAQKESSDAYMSRLNSYLESQLDEKIPPNADVDYYIKDFAKSNAPSLRGKTQEKRRQMAIAAYYGNKQKKKK